MTRKIKKILFYDNSIMRVFLKPSILATRVGTHTVDINYEYKYNLLGMMTINIIQGIFELIWNGLGDFSIDNYFNRAERKTLCNIKKNCFNEKEIKYLSKFPEYSSVVIPNLDNFFKKKEEMI